MEDFLYSINLTKSKITNAVSKANIDDIHKLLEHLNRGLDAAKYLLAEKEPWQDASDLENLIIDLYQSIKILNAEIAKREKEKNEIIEAGAKVVANQIAAALRPFMMFSNITKENNK